MVEGRNRTIPLFRSSSLSAAGTVGKAKVLLTAGFPGKLGFTKCTTSVGRAEEAECRACGVGGRSRDQGCASVRSALRPRGLPPSRRRQRPRTAREEGSGSRSHPRAAFLPCAPPLAPPPRLRRVSRHLPAPGSEPGPHPGRQASGPPRLRAGAWLGGNIPGRGLECGERHQEPRVGRGGGIQKPWRSAGVD